MTKPAITVDVVSDVICPWCFLGKRRLDKAIGLLPDLAVTVRWRPFFLDPTIPPEGIDRQTYLTNKFGAERLKTLHDPLVAAGAADGVPYQFQKITRTPNTMNAHRLIRWSAGHGVQQPLVEALFMAYWNEGRDVGDTDTLISLAGDCGMPTAALAAGFAGDTDKAAVIGEVQQMQSLGIRGVPTYIIAQRYAVQGAQSAEVLAQAIREAA